MNMGHADIDCGINISNIDNGHEYYLKPSSDFNINCKNEWNFGLQ